MVKRSLNIKLLVLMICCILLLGGGVHVLHGFQVKRSAKGLLAHADRAEAEGHPDEAETYLNRYLAFRPDDVDVLLKLGRLLEAPARGPDGRKRALQVYNKAVRIADGQPAIRRKLVDLEIEEGQFSEAKPHLKLLQESFPEDAELAFLLGRCEEDAGQFREAANHYEEARQRDPKRIEAYVRLADLLRLRLGDKDGADRVMDARGTREGGLIAHNDRSAKAYLARARYHRRYEVPGVDPSTDLARAVELAPDDPEILIAAAESARTQGNLNLAREQLTHALERNPGDATVIEALADLEMKSGHAEKAATWLKKGLEGHALEETTRIRLAWFLADSLIQLDRSDEAGRVIDTELQGKRIRGELVAFLRARILVAREKWAEAAKALQDVSPALGALTGPRARGMARSALILLGICYEHIGTIDQRYDAYRRAVALAVDVEAESVPAHMGLAAALVELKRIDEALEQYRMVLPKEPAVGLIMARLQIFQNSLRTAEEQRWKEVDQTLDDVERLLEGDRKKEVAPQVAILRAEALAAHGEFGPARQLVESALAGKPEDVQLWIARASLAGRGSKPEAILAVLDEARGKLGDRIELRIARVGYWVSRGGDGAQAALEGLERDAEALPDEDRLRLWRALVNAYALIGQDTHAAKLCSRLLERSPDDLSLRLILFDLAVRMGDEPSADRAQNQVRRIEGEDGPMGHYCRAILLIRRARLKPGDRGPLLEARGELERAALRRPSWSRVPMALGDVESLSGNLDAAVSHYLRAIVELGDRDPKAISQTFRILMEKGRVAEAAQLVQKLRDEHVPLSGEEQRLAAQVSYRSGDPGLALELARSAVPAQSDNPNDLLFLAQMQWAAGQPAEPTIRRALTLAGDSPKVWLTLIVYLAMTGQKEKAEAALHQAERVLSEDAASLQLAQANAELGHMDRARVLFRMALDANPDDTGTLRAVAAFELLGGRQAEAEALLDRIIKRGGGTTDARWARNLMATIMGMGGNYQRSMKALELLGHSSDKTEAGSGSDADRPEDLRTRAKILAAQPNLSRRREAIAILEGLISRRVHTPDDLFLLAQIHEADGDWTNARKRLLELLSGQDKNPAYLPYYIRALVRHDRGDEAMAYLGKLEQMVPDSPAIVELKARVLVARGKPDEAVALLAELEKGDDKRILTNAILLEQLKQADAAEAVYRRFVEKFRSQHPEVVLRLAGFLGRRGRVKEALDLVDQAWETCPPELVANACVAVLFGSMSKDSRSEQIAKRLEEAIRANPQKLSIQFDLANIRILEGRLSEAEEIYRRLLKGETSRIASLNNLAWLLAMKGKGSADEALSLLKQAADLGGETPSLLDTRSIAHMAKGQADLAVRELEDAIVVKPSDSTYYFHLAQAYQMSGKSGNAVQAFDKAKELGLTLASLHPLEQASYNRLLIGLKRR